jgi:hypothetical protein
MACGLACGQTRHTFNRAMPLGICALLAIQWFGFVRSRRQRPALWNGRAYALTKKTWQTSAS